MGWRDRIAVFLADPSHGALKTSQLSCRGRLRSRLRRLGSLRPGLCIGCLLLLACLFLGHVAANDTPAHGAYHGMLAGNVASDSADGGALDTSRRTGRAAGERDARQ